MCSNIQENKQSQVTYTRISTEIISISKRSFSKGTDYAYEMAA